MKGIDNDVGKVPHHHHWRSNHWHILLEHICWQSFEYFHSFLIYFNLFPWSCIYLFYYLLYLIPFDSIHLFCLVLFLIYSFRRPFSIFPFPSHSVWTESILLFILVAHLVILYLADCIFCYFTLNVLLWFYFEWNICVYWNTWSEYKPDDSEKRNTCRKKHKYFIQKKSRTKHSNSLLKCIIPSYVFLVSLIPRIRILYFPLHWPFLPPSHIPYFEFQFPIVIYFPGVVFGRIYFFEFSLVSTDDWWYPSL